MTALGANPNTPRQQRLAPVLAIAWLNSLGTGCITNGVFFIADQRYDATTIQNYLLGVMMGIVYIGGALGVGPLLRALTRRSKRVSTRGALIAVMLLLAATCLIPWSIQRPWALWLFAAVYLPISGTLWPIVESYVSGGRRGANLRKAIGTFNLTWASAVALAFWFMAPLLREFSLEAIIGLGAIHLLCIPLAALCHREPPRHVDDGSEPHPERYERLLPCFRMLLMLSYILAAAINPLLPWRLERIGVDVEWKMPIASAWGMARIGVFVLFQWWHGWHGRWRTPIWTAGAMLAGFVLTTIAPNAPALLAGLTLFGLGMGGVYYAALYYAMTVGLAEIDAGGKHEATIGMGYALGPLTGALAWGAVATGVAPDADAVLLMLGIESLFIAALVALAIRKSLPKRGA